MRVRVRWRTLELDNQPSDKPINQPLVNPTFPKGATLCMTSGRSHTLSVGDPKGSCGKDSCAGMVNHTCEWGNTCIYCLEQHQAMASLPTYDICYRDIEAIFTRDQQKGIDDFS